VCSSDLKDRKFICLQGAETTEFLNGLITCEVASLDDGQSEFGGLLSPQGKILFDFFVVRMGDKYLIDIDGTIADDFIKRLMLYRLRRKIDMGFCSDIDVVTALWGTHPGDVSTVVAKDPRHPDLGYRLYSTGSPDIQYEVGDYHSHRISLGIPAGGRDFNYGEVFPHETLMDQIGGIDFKKGCYVGQEVVSRMQHRGTARKRIVFVDGNQSLPERGTDITVEGKSVGKMGSSAGSKGLATLRLDRVKSAVDEAIPLVADNVLLKPGLQSWVNFDWP